MNDLGSPPLLEAPDFSIVECGVENSMDWDSFVKNSSGTYCHLFGWKRVIERTYGLQTHYLVFRSAVAWLGVLPLAIMPRLPGGVLKAVSLPYCNYGGLLVAHGVDPAPVKTAFLNYLIGLGIIEVEFRDIAPSMAQAAEVTMILALPESAELLWKQIGDKVRNQIRKAYKAGLTLRWGRDQGDDLYVIYAKNMARLGTPVHSPKFVKEILDSLGECVDVLTVRHEERAIGAMLVIKNGDTWADPMASCLTEFNKFNPNMLMYWESLRIACDTGVKSFDFGRSHRDSGTHRFKKQWGASEVALNYCSYVDGMLSPTAYTNFYRGHSASKLASIWQKLPAFVQMRLGPVVRRCLP
ncbi:GNAT family N-acetyltransferase [Polynucleobacter sp.]|uniref:GNAT family N-acetyltransferase n=1 Tax=Polynucleobacter sp. TaxID=2029855 RepID=UPI003F6971A8